ncbi:MAG: HNH endonuclease [Dehalococcoidia bacterium]
MITRAPVLVLNQNYQPLNICDVRRAVSLVGRGKAESIQQTGEYLHSATDIFEKPEVIRLIYMVKRPIHRRRLSRREVFARDGYRCQYCGIRTRDLTLDHVIPRSRGGVHEWENVVSACKPCNHGKAGRTPREAGMNLRVPPREPRPNPYAAFHSARLLDAWRPFLPWVDDTPFVEESRITASVVLAAGD